MIILATLPTLLDTKISIVYDISAYNATNISFNKKIAIII